MKAIDYFLELTKIPRPSGKEDKVVEYLINYAKKNNLKYEVNGSRNVIITKDNGSNKNIILQAHTDMVCEKLSHINIDFDNDPIQTIIDGDIIKTNGTTLGADDGYGVSTILQILDECGNGYPNIEAIFTSDEEVGMTGARSLNLSHLKSKMIIGLDGTSSSEITTSCAGSQRIQYEKDYNLLDVDLNGYTINVGGLLGGHSGEEINLNRGNANKIIFEFLSKLEEATISNFNGGNKDNAIPREASCSFVSNDKSIYEKFENYLKDLELKYPSELELNVSLSLTHIEKLLPKNISDDLINFVNEFKDGVLYYDTVDTNFPITSINLAKIITEENKLTIRSMLRSSDKEKEEEKVNEFLNLGKKHNLITFVADKTPYFERCKENILETLCVNSYYNLGYKDLIVSGIHAGLEGGVFAEKIEGAQIVCLGADLNQIHTPNESMKISSLTKLTTWIKEILKNLENM